jgi:hypothetical protein
MGRIVRGWTPDKVADATVAPHRYTWDGKGQPDLDECKGYREILAAIPYKEGEAVYVQRGERAVKARIYRVHYERDRFGERRAVFMVQFETAAGLWSKAWARTWAGFIQRGYALAGLAPDVPT